MRTSEVVKGVVVMKKDGTSVVTDFCVWMLVVDMVLRKHVGCDSGDMVDMNYMELYEEGVDAEAAAWEGMCMECEARGMDVQDICPDWKPVNVFVKGGV